MNRNIPILLQGETGTGKDVFAHAIHQASERSDRPFVGIDCAALPETLIESELFGYAPGAFTGARSSGMRGKVLAAHGGTLFLDEIGNMPVTIQARLLRMLEEKEIVPLGSTKAIPVDAKVISATNRDLRALVASGDFRMDLYFRLNGLTLTLPPLRERSDQRSLIETICREEAGSPVAIEPSALAALTAYHWPGNIRELRNTLRTAIAFAGPSTRIELSHLFPSLGTFAGPGIAIASNEEKSPKDSVAAERARIELELERQRWHIGRTAAALGVSRNTLYRKLRGLGLHPVG